ncbi:hypothetical protein BDQ94DRAFT_136327 [Aspergillus welwitschiae]|uniref:Uncharacterized protein n=1 Tax=Aspergillus welwitschiae TaxID=1341132 RepID=A0A3F3QES5_9EURO|nr:hypothetical protein BDQ94DRAFT_136327 [Aspergillus welwitschiae]RDH37382.1 hypothetical protein BDQ94DRAFT_136327 [Aspergillus welwitschiae]
MSTDQSRREENKNSKSTENWREHHNTVVGCMCWQGVCGIVIMIQSWFILPMERQTREQLTGSTEESVNPRWRG